MQNINKPLCKEDIEMVCEAYSENYAIYSRDAVINMLCELLPTYQGDVVAAVIAIRTQLQNVYNIR